MPGKERRQMSLDDEVIELDGLADRAGEQVFLLTLVIDAPDSACIRPQLRSPSQETLKL